MAVRDDPYVARPPGPPAQEAAVGLASTVLLDLQQAVRARDAAAARALAPVGDAPARRLLGHVVANAERAHVTDFTLRYVDEVGAVTGDGWSAAVDATWAFAGRDDGVARAEVKFGFVWQGDEVLLSRVGGGDHHSPVWLTGRVEVRASKRALVLVAGPPREADRYARLARSAVPAVRKVLPGWEGGLVVEVPTGASALHRALDADPGTYDSIAAVTTTADGSQAPEAPTHVFVNPDVFGSLRPRGAQVVMSHEAVHVATDAATSDMPLWVLEGFADYVALRDVDLPLTVTAGQVVRQVRREGLPNRLPGPEDFDTTTPHLGASYEAAWLACRLLADLAGERALVRFYREVERGAAVDPALRSQFGIGLDGLTSRWQGLLRDLAA